MKVCLNCQDRALGCHDNCQKYAADRAGIDLVNSARDKEAGIRSYECDIKIRTTKQIKNGTRRKAI